MDALTRRAQPSWPPAPLFTPQRGDNRQDFAGEENFAWGGGSQVALRHFILTLQVGNHCQALIKLPQIHRDPFDRMLIAQAQTDNLQLLTRDAKILSYN